jgi:hypothetical protein
MYKIIGADQKEYGPVSLEQMRQWLAEGRVNGQTQVQAEGSADWKALAEFPEFGLGAGPATAPTIGALGGRNMGRDEALNRVRAPAIALIVSSSLSIAAGIIGFLLNRVRTAAMANDPNFQDPQFQRILNFSQGPLGLMFAFFGIALALIVLLSACRMISLKNYGFVMAGAVIAVVPCVTPCCGLFTIPFGIWALTVINKPEVRQHFE